MLFFNNQLTQADENVCMDLITCRINSIKKMNHVHLGQYTTFQNATNQFDTIPSSAKDFKDAYNSALVNYRTNISINNHIAFDSYVIVHEDKRTSPAYILSQGVLKAKRAEKDDLLRRYDDIQNIEYAVKSRNDDQKTYLYMSTSIESLDYNEGNQKLLNQFDLSKNDNDFNFKMNQLKKLEVPYNKVPVLIDNFKIAINLTDNLDDRQYINVSVYAAKRLINNSSIRNQLNSSQLSLLESSILLPSDLDLTFCFVKLSN
jgi:hypothetical protein